MVLVIVEVVPVVFSVACACGCVAIVVLNAVSEHMMTVASRNHRACDALCALCCWLMLMCC